MLHFLLMVQFLLISEICSDLRYLEKRCQLNRWSSLKSVAVYSLLEFSSEIHLVLGLKYGNMACVLT